MRSNRKILFGVLILVAVVILYGLYSAVSNSTRTAVGPTPPPAGGPIRPVSTSRGQIAVAAVDIPPHSIVTRDMLKLQDHSGSEQGFVTDLNSQALGFVTRVAIPKGSQIRPSEDFIGHLTQVGIAGALQPGTRAMVLPLANKPSLHDLVRIGNYVDVLAAFDGQEARTIVPGVRVLAVDVYANQFPEESAAMSGPYKAASPGRGVTAAPTTPAGEPDPNATATPSPTPLPANTARPDPSITIEVTPEQATRIHLAIASGANMDYLLLPALPGNRSSDPIANGPTAIAGEESPIPGSTNTPNILPVSVTKAQLAPYAERKKAAPTGGGNGGGNSTRSSRGGGSDGIPIRYNPRPVEPVLPPQSSPGSDGVGPAVFPTSIPAPTQAPPPATYAIPIYADGKVVRNETVLTPQE